MKINVFCFPFAGGSIYSYSSYVRNAPEQLQLIPIELPGRGLRVREAFLYDISDVVADIFSQIRERLDRPYALYGHSMGGILCYLLTRYLEERSFPLPKHLFVSGCKGPSVERQDIPHHSLPRKEFVEKLRSYGGSPEEILHDDAMMTFFEPILRADFCCMENYRYEGTTPLNIPMSVFIGSRENITEDEAWQWRSVTSGNIQVIRLPGNHFFIFDHEAVILEHINDKLKWKQSEFF